MYSLTLAHLAERYSSQDRRQDHAGTVNPGHSLVQTDIAAGLDARHLRRADRVISCRGVHAHRQRSQPRMQIAASWAAWQTMMTFRAGTCENRSNERNSG